MPEMTDPPDTERGLYQKYQVLKLVYGPASTVNGNVLREITAVPMDRPCFVLDYTHDPHAAAALLAYAKSCVSEYPQLATDLIEQLRQHGADFE